MTDDKKKDSDLFYDYEVIPAYKYKKNGKIYENFDLLKQGIFDEKKSDFMSYFNEFDSEEEIKRFLNEYRDVIEHFLDIKQK